MYINVAVAGDIWFIYLLKINKSRILTLCHSGVIVLDYGVHDSV